MLDSRVSGDERRAGAVIFESVGPETCVAIDR